MQSKPIIYLLLFFSVTLLGQNKSIDLPKLEFGTDTLKTQNYYPIHITASHEIYFEDDRIRFWDQVPSRLLELNREPISISFKDIVIYADKSVPYSIIQKLKEEIGRVWSGFIHYKIDTYEGDKVISNFFSGSFYENPGSKGMDWVFDSKIIYTRDEKDGTSSVPNLEAISFPVPAHWQHNFSTDFKELNATNIKYSMAEIVHRTIHIDGSKEHISINDETLYWNEMDKIKNLVASSDLIFLKTKYGLTFGDFVDTMGKIQSFRSYTYGPMHGILRKPYILEIPYVFEEDVDKILSKL